MSLASGAYQFARTLTTAWNRKLPVNFHNHLKSQYRKFQSTPIVSTNTMASTVSTHESLTIVSTPRWRFSGLMWIWLSTDPFFVFRGPQGYWAIRTGDQGWGSVVHIGVYPLGPGEHENCRGRCWSSSWTMLEEHENCSWGWRLWVRKGRQNHGEGASNWWIKP